MTLRRRWLLTLAGAGLLVAGVLFGLSRQSRSSHPIFAPPPGKFTGASSVGSPEHCVAAITEGLTTQARSLPASRRAALPKTIGAVCHALPPTTRLGVAAEEVLTIMRSG